MNEYLGRTNGLLVCYWSTVSRCRFKEEDGGRHISILKQLVERVRQLTAGFFDLGIRKGDRIAVLSESRPEWTITDLATVGLGGQQAPGIDGHQHLLASFVLILPHHRLAATRGVMPRAARLWGATEAIRLPLGPLPDDSNRPGYERYIALVRAKMREQAFHSAKKDGEAMSLEQAMHFALEPAVAESSLRPTKSIRKSYPAGLSAREVEVLALVAQGLTDGEVAERLVLSPRTVHAHLTSIYNKLGVNSRVAATRFALEQKLV